MPIDAALLRQSGSARGQALSGPQSDWVPRLYWVVFHERFGLPP